jgi:hypothetical protein
MEPLRRDLGAREERVQVELESFQDPFCVSGD